MRLLTFILVLSLATFARADVYLTITRPSHSGPSAQAQASADARRQVDQAQAEYRRAFAKGVADHPMSYQLREAQKNLSKAYARLNDVRAQAITSLRAESTYRRAEGMIREQEEKLLREEKLEKRLELAGELLRLRSTRTAMESKRLEENEDVRWAYSAVQGARVELEKVEKEYRWHLVQSDQLSQARLRLNAARDQLASVGD